MPSAERSAARAGSGASAAAVLEDYSDKDVGRSPCSLRTARSLRLADPRECRRGRDIGVMMIVDSAVGLEATSVVIGKLQE